MKHLNDGTLRLRPAVAAALAAMLIAALLLTPLGGYAASLLTVFEPHTFQPIEVSRGDLRQLRLLPQAEDVGTQRVLRKPQRQTYDSISAAQRHVDFTILRPAALPRDLGAVHSFTAMTPGLLTYTFSASKARAFAARSHKRLPPMPPALDGTTVRLQTGYVFNARYEGADAHQRRRGQSESRDLIIVQARAPRVTSTGASLDELERYLLVMPNVSPQLASQIRALGDIQNIVPVPVMLDRQTARRVTVHNAPGLAIGDNTGLGAGVVWQSGGIVYLVAGPLSMDEVMNVADGLR